MTSPLIINIDKTDFLIKVNHIKLHIMSHLFNYFSYDFKIVRNGISR